MTQSTLSTTRPQDSPSAWMDLSEKCRITVGKVSGKCRIVSGKIGPPSYEMPANPTLSQKFPAAANPQRLPALGTGASPQSTRWRRSAE